MGRAVVGPASQAVPGQIAEATAREDRFADIYYLYSRNSPHLTRLGRDSNLERGSGGPCGWWPAAHGFLDLVERPAPLCPFN